MISPTLLIMATSLLTRAVAAASAPVCVSSSEGYQVGQVNYLFNTFCNQLKSSNFATQQQVYGLPYISFDYASGSTSDTCDLTNCLASYQTLVQSCALPNSTIWGTGSLDAGCGVYNFTIWDSAEYPVALGSPTTTIQGATLTTAPIITSTSSSSSSTTSLSVSSSSSAPVSISATVTASSTVQSPVYYSNGTSTTSSSAYGAASGSGVVGSASVTASQSVTENPASTTKPAVGSTALGTSGGNILRTSGFSLIAVACVFAWWF